VKIVVDVTFQVEPGTKLFPGVIYEPTSVDNLHFEIGRTRVSVQCMIA